VIVKSFEAQVRKRVWRLLGDNLEDGVNLYSEAVRDKISVQGPPRSTPGNPPHMDTTALHEGFGYTVIKEQLTARAGSDQSYSLDLEFGNSRMQPRPFIRSTLIERRDDIAREMTKT